MENQSTYILYVGGSCAALLLLQAFFHSVRSTDAWIELEFSGVFGGPAVIAGGFVGATTAVTVCVFDGPWQAGTTIGLLLAVVACVFLVLFSLVAP